jgi:hypothetical protein
VGDLEELKKYVTECIVADAPVAQKRTIIRALTSADSAGALRKVLHEAYRVNNWIEFRDAGRGMSLDDLLRAYLVIGTPSRRRDLDAALESGSSDAPYLGEKGVGRLSAMRLGSALHVRTATAEDRRYNLLNVDWSQFDDLDKLVEDIILEPTTGDIKALFFNCAVNSCI